MPIQRRQFLKLAGAAGLGLSLPIARRFAAAAGEPIDLAAFRAAIAADQRLRRPDGAAGGWADQVDAHAAFSRTVRHAPIVSSTGRK